MEIAEYACDFKNKIDSSFTVTMNIRFISNFYN